MTEYRQIYFDTTLLIYYLDSVQPYAQKVRSFIAAALSQESSLMTSTIANTEYLAIPFRERDYEKVTEFEQFKRLLNLDSIIVDSSVSTQAARIRAKYKGIKGRDSIHLATAIASDCHSAHAPNRHSEP